MAWLSERRRLLWATLWVGHAGTANGAREFLAHAVTRLPADHTLGLVRADSGFFQTTFLAELEARDIPYIIVARLTPILRKLVLHRLPADAPWRRVAPGIEVADAQVAPCRCGAASRDGSCVCAKNWPSGPRRGGGA